MPWDLVSQPLQGSREVGQDKAGPDIPIYSCDPLDPRPPPAPAVLAALASPTEQPEIAVLETPLPAAVCLPLLGGLLRRQPEHGNISASAFAADARTAGSRAGLLGAMTTVSSACPCGRSEPVDAPSPRGASLRVSGYFDSWLTVLAALTWEGARPSLCGPWWEEGTGAQEPRDHPPLPPLPLAMSPAPEPALGWGPT